MSQARLSSPKNVDSIEIALSTKTSVSSKSGSLKFQLRQADFRSVERLLWRAIFLDAIMKAPSSTWSAATCRYYAKMQSE